MIKLESVIKYFLRKDNILLFIGLSVLIILNAPIETFLTKTLITPLLSHIQPKWYTDLIIIFISLFIILLTKFRLRKYVASKQLLILGILTSVAYLYYRQSGIPWTFTSFHWIDRLKYADLLILGVICQALLFVPRKKEKAKDVSDSLFEDKPIGEKGEDILGYSSYAELLGNKILKSHFDKSFAIGINGKWGSGKTSFIDLLKRTVKADDIIEINFTPWNSQTPQAIIQDFFNSFNEMICPFHSSITRLSQEYADRLVKIENNKLTRSIQLITTLTNSNRPTNYLFDKIDKALKKINKKIIIYIDDLDRLDSNEIVEVLRLIRNTANFYNTIFVVAYDRNYIVNALSRHNSFGEIEFLEKIFQLEVTLPNFNKDILRKELAKKLKQNFQVANWESIDQAIIGKVNSKPLHLEAWLETMRDVTRLANTITLNYSKLVGEVIFHELLQLELLRLKYPSIYKLLKERKADFFHSKYDQFTNKSLFILSTRIIKEKEPKLNNNENLSLSEYLNENSDTHSIEKEAIPKVIDLVSTLFTDVIHPSLSKNEPLSIVYSSKFDRYFTYALPDGQLSEIEFSKARDLDQNGFHDKISEWVKLGLASELQRQFYEIRTFDNWEDFEKVIRAIFHLAKMPIKESKIVNFESNNLLYKLNNHHNSLAKRYYPKEDGEKQLKTFVRSLFDQAQGPYLFEIQILTQMNEQITEMYPINKEDRSSLLIQYFKDYCDEINKWNNHIWTLFHYSKKVEWVSNGGSSHTRHEEFTQEGKDIFKNFALNKDFDGFLQNIKKNEHNNQSYTVNSMIPVIFNNWENFENELNKKDETQYQYLEEFNRFYKLFASSNHSQAVTFKFKKISV